MIPLTSRATPPHRPALACLAVLCLALVPLGAPVPAEAAGDGHAAHDDHHHDEAHAGDHDHDDHLAEAHGLRALHAWTPQPSGREVMVYMELENVSDAPITISGGAAEIAANVELVGFTLQDGNPAWEVLPGVPISPGRELDLAPDGLALRLTGVGADLHEGAAFPMQVLTDRGALDLVVAVEPAGARQHSHAGHAH